MRSDPSSHQPSYNNLRNVYKPYQEPPRSIHRPEKPLVSEENGLDKNPQSLLPPRNILPDDRREPKEIPVVLREEILFRESAEDKQRVQQKPLGLKLAIANRSDPHDDSSLRSDGSTSSGRAFSGRSSTTSKPQSSRCYACKDSMVSAEQAERAESLETFVSCERCSRRYHTRCARGYDRYVNFFSTESGRKAET